jgi:serum/glucocorticoid-regulated kinase 2
MTDWWAIGILLYELLVGICPFYNQNQSTMYSLILELITSPFLFPMKISAEISGDCKDLIEKVTYIFYSSFLSKTL